MAGPLHRERLSVVSRSCFSVARTPPCAGALVVVLTCVATQRHPAVGCARPLSAQPSSSEAGHWLCLCGTGRPTEAAFPEPQSGALNGRLRPPTPRETERGPAARPCWVPPSSHLVSLRQSTPPPTLWSCWAVVYQVCVVEMFFPGTFLGPGRPNT